jgi:hypothetical protein
MSDLGGNSFSSLRPGENLDWAQRLGQTAEQPVGGLGDIGQRGTCCAPTNSSRKCEMTLSSQWL